MPHRTDGAFTERVKPRKPPLRDAKAGGGAPRPRLRAKTDLRVSLRLRVGLPQSHGLSLVIVPPRDWSSARRR